jgi:23S rRNA (cytosine1962-C5)-methyltransferase
MSEKLKRQKAKGKSESQNSKVENEEIASAANQESEAAFGARLARQRGIFQQKNIRADEPLGSRSFEAAVILNLFGYTGGATLACAQAGASVVHIDGSKVSIKRAKENAELSGLAEKPIRWILDDAREFVKRELRRGNKYDGIIMDPPSFGRGDKGQVWKIEEDFVPLFNDCVKLLSDKPIFFLINGYAAGYSAITYANNLKILQKKFGGTIEAGELTIEEGKSRGPNGGNESQARFLPCGIFARWKAE